MELRINLDDRPISSHQKAAIKECLGSILNNDWDNLYAFSSVAANQLKTSHTYRSVNHLHREMITKSESHESQGSKWDSFIHDLKSCGEGTGTLRFFRETLTQGELDQLSCLNLRNDSAIASLGSCFATNISRYLGQVGFEKVFSLRLEEAVASPRTLLTYLSTDELHAGTDDPTKFEERFSVRSHNLPDLVGDLELIVLTLGVGWDLVDSHGKLISDTSQAGRLLRRGFAKFRYDSVEEQKNRIVRALRLLKAWNPCLTIVVSLSPIPLSGFFSNDYHVVRANTVSKASLALAIEQAQQEERFIYLPSYEWVTLARPAVTDVVSFGEDSTTRHPKNLVVAEICDAFISLCRDSSTKSVCDNT